MREVEVIRANRKISERTAGKKDDILHVAPYARVSTDSEEQLSSYKSQVMYYKDLVNSRKEWVLVDIYADESITGTQVARRENFQRMINDCMDGKIDMIITKSISRFARNTLDTLKYVRMLKERNIAAFFEEENINTMTMDGELLLVILSSVAQQEVENISANVKKGLKMKMKRGELVGFASCLRYDYDPIDKSISINEAEADIVRYIFDRYIEGAGGYVIAKELTKLGYKTKYGNSQWHDTGVLGIIKNEKYKGDVLQGKTFTVDPISKRRLDNYGEEDQFYIKNHHEPIVSEEIFEKAQAILNKRGAKRRGVKNGKREKYSRKYAFSSMLECASCGSNLSRRNWHSGTKHEKVIWQCVTATKKGRKYCPHSKAIEERILEDAFIESYKLLCYNNSDVSDELVNRMENILSDNNFQKRLVREIIKNIFYSHEPEIRRLEMEKFFFGAYEVIDDVITFLVTVGFIKYKVERNRVLKLTKKSYYVTKLADEKMKLLMDDMPYIKLYLDRCLLIKEYFGEYTGTQLKNLQYKIDEYRDTTYREYIKNIDDLVKTKIF